MLNMLELLIIRSERPNVFRRNILHGTSFYKLCTPCIHNSLFAVIVMAKITCITVSCVIHFMTAGFTVPLGVLGVYIRT